LSRAQALAQLRAGSPQAAAAILEALLQTEPGDAQAWFLLGACRHAQNHLNGAAAAFGHSVALEPTQTEAHLALISVLRAGGDFEAANAAATQALALIAGSAPLHYASALALEDLGRQEEALAQYDRALDLDAGLEDALHNRGLLLARLGRLEEAMANHRRYAAAFPLAARAHSALADFLLAADRLDEAAHALDALQRIAPQDAGARVRQGVLLASQQRFTEAAAAFAVARATDAAGVEQYLRRVTPGSGIELMLSPENVFLWRWQLKRQRCDWSSWQAGPDELRRLPAKTAAVVEPAAAFMALHTPLSGSERHDVARHVGTHIERHSAVLPPLRAVPRAPIRLGILSPDLREHLNAYLLLPLFELLDRTRFELCAYSLAADDGSAIRATLRGAANQFRELHAMTDEVAAKRIRADAVDILLDVGGYTAGARFGITARRPAALQVNYLGFPGSLGSHRVDYAIVDRVVAGAEGEWSESLVHLPHTYFLYDFRTPVPQLELARRDYGLPDDAFVFCAFHRPDKISPDAFALWTRVLARVPDSVLWLLALPAEAQANLRRAAGEHGVDPARLVFAPFDPRARYLARQRLGDLMLDAVHHSAMTTAFDALASGLPVLALRGNAMASRAGESLLRAAGLPELVAPDAQSYVEHAAQLAGDPARLAQYRERLQSRAGALFDTAARVRELQAAFEWMWERALRPRQAPAG
jgi:predicted O-linked N-acetylglucosamine transferase (SPINDLY family)